MRILILGGNGFIGEAIARHALDAGHEVACIGRNIDNARSRLPQCEWHRLDIAKLSSPADWHRFVEGRDAVINAAGALQDGSRDNLEAVQSTAMQALYQALERTSTKFIQVSANTSSAAAHTPFLRTKLTADKALADSGLNYLILRPALVIGRNAHGGTALVRAAAGFPYACPIVFGETQCQTTDLDTLCNVVVGALTDTPEAGRDCNIAHPEPLSLRQLTLTHRRWLGLPGNPTFPVPTWLAGLAGKFADLAGWLGWRSPFRTTALKVLQTGIETDPALPTLPTPSLDQTLLANPAGVQDLWAARLYLLKPLIIACLSPFWIITGLIALWSLSASAANLTAAGFSETAAVNLAIGTSLADILLGALLLWRSTARTALIGMIALSIVYLLSGSILNPQLWLDPLGPFVKVVPSILLACTGLALLDER